MNRAYIPHQHACVHVLAHSITLGDGARLLHSPAVDFSHAVADNTLEMWDGSNPVESTWKRFGSSRCAPALSGYGRHSQILRGGEVHLPPSLSASCILFFYEWPSPPGAATKDFVTFCHAGTLARGHAWYRVISESLSPSRFDRWQSRTVRRIVPSAHQHLCKPTLGLIRSISFRLVREKMQL